MAGDPDPAAWAAQLWRAGLEPAAGPRPSLGSLGAVAVLLIKLALAPALIGWMFSLAIGWLAASVLTGGAALLAPDPGPPLATCVACISLGGAAIILAWFRSEDPQDISGRPGIVARTLVTILLMASLRTSVTVLGPAAGGLLAALPVLASLLAVFTHREAGGAAAIQLLRGTLAGMAGFVAFCEVVAALIVPAGAATAFAVATAVALCLQGVCGQRAVYAAARNSAGRWGEARACLNPSASRSAV